MLRMSTFVTPSSNSEEQQVETTDALVLMSTSLIRHQINMGIHDIMYQISQHLVCTIKLKVHNEVQQVMEFKAR